MQIRLYDGRRYTGTILAPFTEMMTCLKYIFRVNA